MLEDPLVNPPDVAPPDDPLEEPDELTEEVESPPAVEAFPVEVLLRP